MTFTKKHFKSIAQVFSNLSVDDHKSGPGRLTRSWMDALTVIDSFCDLFEQDNPKFDKRCFIKLCGFEPWDELIMGYPDWEKGMPIKHILHDSKEV